jgi:cyclopropane fatty-acyl-phospholipid synthase-like methyltransferase
MHDPNAFKNAEESAIKLDDPERDSWQKPEEVFDILAIKATDKVVDFGAGTGYFSVRAAERVPEGVVHALDVSPEMLQYIDKRAATAGLKNIVTRQIDYGYFALPELVNAVLVVNTYHHIADRNHCFSALRSWLLPNAKLAIIDFTEESPMGPPAEHRMNAEFIRKEIEAAGYTRTQSFSNLPYQSFQIFQVP